MANVKSDSPFIIHNSTSARSASSTPYGNRTRVLALRGLCPRPLDERGSAGRKRFNVAHLQPIVNPWQGSTEAPPGFEPGVEDLQSSALPLGHGAGTTRAGNRARTGDLNLGKVALYQLSYARAAKKALKCRKSGPFRQVFGVDRLTAESVAATLLRPLPGAAPRRRRRRFPARPR